MDNDALHCCAHARDKKQDLEQKAREVEAKQFEMEKSIVSLNGSAG